LVSLLDMPSLSGALQELRSSGRDTYQQMFDLFVKGLGNVVTLEFNDTYHNSLNAPDRKRMK